MGEASDEGRRVAFPLGTPTIYFNHVYVEDTDLENGCLRLLPGSHRCGSFGGRKNDEEAAHSIKDGEGEWIPEDVVLEIAAEMGAAAETGTAVESATAFSEGPLGGAGSPLVPVGPVDVPDPLVPVGPVDVHVPAGSAVIFDARMVHAAHANKSGERSRNSFFAHYCNGDAEFSWRGVDFGYGKYADRHRVWEGSSSSRRD